MARMGWPPSLAVRATPKRGLPVRAAGLYPHAYAPLPRATMVHESYSLAAYLAADRSAFPFLGAL